MCARVYVSSGQKEDFGGPEKDALGLKRRPGVSYEMFRGQEKTAYIRAKMSKKNRSLFLGLVAGLSGCKTR